MPVQTCSMEGKSGYKYGKTGKCYTYSDEPSRKKAKQQAYLQGAAIAARTGEKLEKEETDIMEEYIDKIDAPETVYPDTDNNISEDHPVVKECGILKMDDDRHLVYGIVLVPNLEDLQGDIVSPEEIEVAAHDYMINSQKVFKGHKGQTDAKVVESYIAPTDIPMGGQTIPAGSWIMVTKIYNTSVWESVKKGELTGYSIGGTGERSEVL